MMRIGTEKQLPYFHLVKQTNGNCEKREKKVRRATHFHIIMCVTRTSICFSIETFI